MNICQKKILNQQPKFFLSPIINKRLQAKLEDFKNSGYDCGHNASAGNYVTDKELEKETYNLLNISPQNNKLNSQVKSQFEDYCRKLAKNLSGIYIITGPLNIPIISNENGKKYQNVKNELIGDGLTVPTHYFKIIYKKGSCTKSYLFPNEDKDFKKNKQNDEDRFKEFECELKEIE